MIINPTNVRERRKTGYTHDSLQRSHISSPAKNILRRSFYFSFPMKQLETLLPEMPSSTSHLHKGLVTCGRRHFSWFGGIWLHFFECKGKRLNNIRSNAFCNLQTLGGLPWWGYGTIGAQCSVRHFARVDNALMGLRCVELQYFAVLQRVDNALMEVATTTEVRPWHLRSLHPTPCPLLASTISSSTSPPTSLPTPSYVSSPNQTWHCIEFPNLRWKLNRNWG